MCRNWLRGSCRYMFGRGCKFPHPVFDLPPNQPHPEVLVVHLWPEAPLYKRATAATGGAKSAAKEAGVRASARPAAFASPAAFNVGSVTPEQLQEQELLLAAYGRQTEQSQAAEQARAPPPPPAAQSPPPPPAAQPPPPQQPALHGAVETMRIVSWMGHWICSCGERISPVRRSRGAPSGPHSCPTCGQIPPCK